MTSFIRLGLAVILAAFLVADTADAQRGFGGARRGGGGSRGGGISRGGGSSPGFSRSSGSRSISRPSTSVSRSSGSIRSGSTTRPSTTSGRSFGQSGVRTGTTQRGGTVTVGGARGAAGGSSGAAAGRVGGAKLETPGGRTITKGGAAGAVRGPGGAAAGAARGGSSTGAGGGTVGGRQSVVGGRSFATDSGFAKYRGGVAVRGPGGGAAVAHRTTAVTTSARRATAATIRRGAVTHTWYHTCFRPGWYAGHPHAWHAARWTAAAVWTAAAWNSLHAWWGWSTPVSQPVYYDYGNTIVYEGDTVYNGTEQIASAEEYYEQAAEIAEQGTIEVSDEEEWRSLGVFGMVQGDNSEANKILQLAVNKQGIIRGSHYDVLTESVLPIEGAVDEKTQRAAWTVGDNKDIVYETGIYNLTEQETQLLIHFGTDRTQQWLLVRLEEPDDLAKEDK